MKLKQNLIDIFGVIANDNTINRLLYYPDNPLDPTKAEVNTLPDYYTTIRKERIIRAPKSNDISTKQICRICMYFARRTGTSSIMMADQDIVFDVYAHIDMFEINDSRSLMILERINELLEMERITGIGKMMSSNMGIIGNAPDGYIGYRIGYRFGDFKK